MQVPTSTQIIYWPDGNPAFVVVPYADYVLQRKRHSTTVPDEVARLILVEHKSPARAWREHLDLTRAVVAQRLGISKSTYAKQETREHLSRTYRKKIATALGISAKLLDL